MSDSANECVKVVVRCRPLSQNEINENCFSIIEFHPNSNTQLGIKNSQVDTIAGQDATKEFSFDRVFDDKTPQKLFYEDACFNLVESVVEGFNATIFAYGQTGSGKSFTMQGPSNQGNENMRGVIPNAFSHIFEFIKSSKNIQFLVRCSYLEIYNEEILDLLYPHQNSKTITKCEIRDDPIKGVFVQGLTNIVVDTEEQMLAEFERGLRYRTTASTLMNSESSRSHSIFTIVIELSSKDENGEEHVKAGKLNLVDLAGSERQKRTGATGKTLKEGARINLSLLTLGNVISALARGKAKHISYRDSKLTRLLQDSLGGNTKTCMIAAISPANNNYEETLSTLRYANNAKNIQNRPRVNEDPNETMIREFRAEIERLKQQLINQSTGVVTESNSADPNHSIVLEKLKEKEEEIEKERKMKEELFSRLQELQNKFLGQSGNDVQNSLSEQQRLEAELIHNQRKRNAQKFNDSLSKSNFEINDMDDEYNDLKTSLENSANGNKNNKKTDGIGVADQLSLLKKLIRVKKKYEKEIRGLKSELEDTKDDFEYSKDQLLDNLRDEEKNSKLYFGICRLFLSDKEIVQHIEKCTYNEELDEWNIPPFHPMSKKSSKYDFQSTNGNPSSRPPSNVDGGGFDSLRNTLRSNGTSSRQSTHADDYLIGMSSFLPGIALSTYKSAKSKGKDGELNTHTTSRSSNDSRYKNGISSVLSESREIVSNNSSFYIPSSKSPTSNSAGQDLKASNMNPGFEIVILNGNNNEAIDEWSFANADNEELSALPEMKISNSIKQDNEDTEYDNDDFENEENIGSTETNYSAALGTLKKKHKKKKKKSIEQSTVSLPNAMKLSSEIKKPFDQMSSSTPNSSFLPSL